MLYGLGFRVACDCACNCARACDLTAPSEGPNIGSGDGASRRNDPSPPPPPPPPPLLPIGCAALSLRPLPNGRPPPDSLTNAKPPRISFPTGAEDDLGGCNGARVLLLPPMDGRRTEDDDLKLSCSTPSIPSIPAVTSASWQASPTRSLRVEGI